MVRVYDIVWEADQSAVLLSSIEVHEFVTILIVGVFQEI